MGIRDIDMSPLLASTPKTVKCSSAYNEFCNYIRQMTWLLLNFPEIQSHSGYWRQQLIFKD